MIFLLNPSVFAATVIVSLTGLTTDSLGNYARTGTSIGYSVAGTPSSQKWQFSANGSTVSGDISGATGTTFTPVIGSNVTNYHYIRVAVTISSVEYYSPWTQVANISAVVGTSLDFSFGRNIELSVVNLLQNWTLNGNTVASFNISPTLPEGLSASIVSSEVRLTGTPTAFTTATVFTLTVFDTRGRPVSDTFTLEIVVPTIADIPVTTYDITLPAPVTTRFSLTETADVRLLGTGTGDFTVTITSPAPYIGGPYTTDLSVEGGSSNFNFESIVSAPQAIVRPTISRTVVAPGGSQLKVGDTFAATNGLWMYDADDQATVTFSGQWSLDGSPISGATTPTYVATAAGDLTYLETVTGAGTTRTALSSAITVNSINRIADIPVTTYTLSTFTPDIWSITPSVAAATINSFVPTPSTPAWSITAGNNSATITDFPGEI